MDRMKNVQEVLERSNKILRNICSDFVVKPRILQYLFRTLCFLLLTHSHYTSLSLHLYISLYFTFHYLFFKFYAASKDRQLYFFHNNINIVVASNQILYCSQKENENVENFMLPNCLSIFILQIQNRKDICLPPKDKRAFYMQCYLQSIPEKCFGVKNKTTLFLMQSAKMQKIHYI